MTTDHTPDTGQPDGSVADGATAYSAEELKEWCEALPLDKRQVIHTRRFLATITALQAKVEAHEIAAELARGNEVQRLEEKDKEIERLTESVSGLEELLHETVELGSRQAEEWDRFWEAMGVDSADITVDDAIAKYKALQAEVERLREQVTEALQADQESHQMLVDVVAERDRLRAELAEVQKCSVCLGTGDPGNGKPCICEGTGSVSRELSGLRRMIYDAQVEIDRKDDELAEVREAVVSQCGPIPIPNDTEPTDLCPCCKRSGYRHRKIDHKSWCIYWKCSTQAAGEV